MGEERYTDKDGKIYIFSAPMPSATRPTEMVVTVTLPNGGHIAIPADYGR